MWKIVFSFVLSLAFAIALHSQASPTTTTSDTRYDKTEYIPTEFAIIEAKEKIEERDPTTASGQAFGDGAHKRFKVAVEGNLTREN